MDAHHTATSGIQALDIQSAQSEAVPDDATTLHTANNRKRQKVTHLTTTPLLTDPRASKHVQSASNSAAGAQVGPHGGEFDYLLHWQQAGDEIVGDDETIVGDDETIVGDDEMIIGDDEMIIGEDDDDDDGFEELEEDDADDIRQENIDTLPARPGRSKLTEDQIVNIINDSINHYSSTWKPNKDILKGDEVNYNVEEMWLTAERTGTRQELVKTYKTDVEYYTQRLDKLCDEILKTGGSSLKEIKRQCRHIEMTVNSIELSHWLLSIYALNMSDDDYDDAKEDVDDNDMSGTREGQSIPQTPRRLAAVIVDLGSPPDSSDSAEDGMIVDSSPAPKTPTLHRSSTPDSVIGDSIVPESTIADSVIGESVIVDTTERPTPVPELPGDSGYRASTPRNTTDRIYARHHVSQQYNSELRHGDKPEEASMMASNRWRWEDLTRTQDRKRLVTKVIQGMRADDRETIRHRLATVGKAHIIREIPICVEMLAKRDTRMHGVLPRDLPKIVTFTRLFLSWWLCDNYFRAEPSRWDLDELRKCLQEQSPDPSVFYDYVQKIMSTTFSSEALRHPDRPSQAEIIEISDDEEPPTQPTQPQHNTQVHRSNPFEPPDIIDLD